MEPDNNHDVCDRTHTQLKKVVSMIYAKGKTIQKEFDVGSTVVNQCRRFIAEHPERYSQYGNLGALTSVVAFTDAYKYRKTETADLPPFEPYKIIRLMEVKDGRKISE